MFGGGNKSADQIKEENKDENDVEADEEDKKKHKVIAEGIKSQLTKNKQNDKEDFKDFHKRVEKQGEELEDQYQPQLKKGINLDVQFKPVKEDEKDGDMDIRITIQPNNLDESFILDANGNVEISIKRVLFVQNSEVDLSKANYDEILKQKLSSISQDLISPDLATRKDAVSDIRKGPLKEGSTTERWTDIAGAINVNFIDEHMQTINELEEELEKYD